MRSLVSAQLLVGLLVMLSACGDDDAPAAARDAGQDAGSIPIDGGSIPGDASMPSDGSSTPADSEVPSDSATPADSSPPDDASVPTDASTPVDASIPTDGGSGGDGVRCLGAAADCTAGEICCAGPLDIVCRPASDPCAGQVLACDGTEDCPGAMCCSTADGTACMASCTGYHICRTSAECATGESCCPNGGGIPLGALTHCLALPAGGTCPLPP